jgi:hypothetical protein
MREDDLEHVLSNEEDLLPSSGFTASVMDAVRRDASLSPSIPFPWKRALPGLIVAGLALMWVFVGIVELALKAGEAQPAPVQPTVLDPILRAMISPQMGWIALVLLSTIAFVRLALRPVSGKS